MSSGPRFLDQWEKGMDTTRAGDGLGMMVSSLAIPKQRRASVGSGKACVQG